jgi:hypothetical protein
LTNTFERSIAQHPTTARRRTSDARAPRVATALVAILLAAMVIAGCSGDDDDDDAGALPSTTAPGATSVVSGAVPDGAVPQPTAVAAVEALLTAEVALDRATSFTTIGGALRVEFPTVGAWERRRNQLGTPISFTVEPGSSESIAVARVEHVPSLDPFRGLVNASEVQTWTAEPVEGGWLLVAEPEVEPVLPDEALAVESATAWAEAVRACDQDAAAEHEGVSILFGDGSLAAGLCGAPDAVVAGAPVPLASGVVSADIVAQFSSDALLWARVVPITAPIVFGVVVAPIGDDWSVIGIAPS